MRYIFWLLTIVLTSVFIVFTVANRNPVVIDFWPFEFQQSLPFSLVVLASLLFGFLVGALLMWLRFGVARSRARHAEQRAVVLERELTKLKRSSGRQGAGAAAQSTTTALSPQSTEPQTPRLPAASGGR